MHTFDFDRIIDRSGTHTIKYDRRKELFGAENILPMWVADMDFSVPPPVSEAIRKRSEHPVYGYTMRPPVYFETIVAWLKKRHGWEIETDWIHYSPGVVPALNILIQEFSQPGDGVILQSPVYHPFFHAIRNNNRRLLNNRLVEKNNKYTIDFDDLSRKAKEAKILLLSHPHNPVGRSWTREELLKLGEICLENNVLIVSDEIHADLTMPGYKHIPLAAMSPELAEATVTCIAPSKTFNLAGLSTSSVIIKNEHKKKRFKAFIERLHLNMGNLFGMIASTAAYGEGEPWLDALLRYLQENICFVTEFLENEIPRVRISPVEATYLLWLDFRELNMTTGELNSMLTRKAKLGLNDGTIFGQGGVGFQRMNVACPKSIVEQAMENLKKAIQ
ncbi:MAG: putative C-S lyase [Chlorobi bacterium]|nr:putative C-S lyase [Chlorobiota bacterium]